MCSPAETSVGPALCHRSADQEAAGSSRSGAVAAGLGAAGAFAAGLRRVATNSAVGASPARAAAASPERSNWSIAFSETPVQFQNARELRLYPQSAENAAAFQATRAERLISWPIPGIDCSGSLAMVRAIAPSGPMS